MEGGRGGEGTGLGSGERVRGRVLRDERGEQTRELGGRRGKMASREESVGGVVCCEGACENGRVCAHV